MQRRVASGVRAVEDVAAVSPRRRRVDESRLRRLIFVLDEKVDEVEGRTVRGGRFGRRQADRQMQSILLVFLVVVVVVVVVVDGGRGCWRGGVGRRGTRVCAHVCERVRE